MLRSARWDDDATQAARFQGARDLAHRLPKKFRVLESLAGDNHVHTFGGNLPPVVRIVQNHIDIRTGGEIDPDVFPRRQGKERTVTAVDVILNDPYDWREERNSPRL